MFSRPTSRWAAGATAVGLGLVAVTYVGLVGPRRGEAADLETSAVTAQQQNDTLQITVAQLRAQFAGLPQREADLATVLGQMPVDADIPQVLRSLDTLATRSGVTLDAVTPGTAQLLDGQGHAAASGTSAPVTASGGGAAGMGRLVGVPVTVSAHGPYFKAVTFLKGLQTGQRAFLVSGLQVTVAGTDVTMTVKGRVFALPGAAQALAGLPAGTSPSTPPPTPPAASTPAPSSPASSTPSASSTSPATPPATPRASSAPSPSPSR